jgi:phosphoglycolate phosphatase-like HAD superfamily hydrolase
VSADRPGLAAVLGHADTVLFDFDGPLCDVFAGLPSSAVAKSLERLTGPTSANDPLEVLRIASNRPDVDVQSIDDQLIAAEVLAVSSSVPNLDGVTALRSCIRLGRQVGIVSNNSEQAIHAFLAAHELDDLGVLVVGRAYGRPELMKPNPWALTRALMKLSASVERSVFIGDSLSDIEAAAAINTQCIALANKPGKRARFEATGAIVVDRIAELSAALAAIGRPNG